MSSPSSKVENWIKVLYDYKYTTRDGHEVTITKDEKLILLAKTNSDWWHAQRVTENQPFFVPANHVEEILTSDDTILNAQDRHHSESEPSTNSKEEKKNHDSFRSVIRRLSGNRKNSVNNQDEKQKVKDTTSESSTFAKCFGLDQKNTDNRIPQNRFQEELSSALVNRSQRNLVFSSKLNDQIEQKVNSEKQRSPVSEPSAPSIPQQKLDKLTQKLQETKPKNIENLTKEFESKVHKFSKPSEEESSSHEPPTQSILKKPMAERRSMLKIDLPKPQLDEKEPEKPRVEKPRIEKPRVEKPEIEKPKIRKREMEVKKVPKEEEVLKKSAEPKKPVVELDDEAILRDKRKMWAIERLMAELTRSKMPTVDEEVQESVQETVKEKEVQSEKKSSSKEKPVFDFSVSPTSVGPSSVAKKSPKILDEYNEANILNDEAGDRKKLNYEKPSYSSIPAVKPKRRSSSIKVKLKNSQGELQLTPSLEKLASEIQFIPANKVAESRQCSKSDTALNEFYPPKMIPKTFGSLDKSSDSKRAVKPKRLDIFTRKFSFASNKDKKQQLGRKARSLDDLNRTDEDVSNNNTARVERRKPMQLFKSADSLKKNVTKPVPAKRKVFDVLDKVRPKPVLTGSCENITSQKWPIDLERSTAVGFKRLLRTSDSGSEEFLQNKTFPNVEEGSSNDNLFDSFDGKNSSGEMGLSSFDSGQSIVDNVQLPEGWKQQIDLQTRKVCYVNDYGDKWFSSNDAEGKIYFFEQNSNKSSWALPALKNRRTTETARRNSTDNNVKAIKQLECPESVQDFKLNNWPQLLQGNMCILKEGFLNRTKITEHGKKLKKDWNTSYAVLTELFLLIFRDEKVFSLMKMGYLSTSKPDISVDLNGASIESGEKFSSRRNVFLINTIFGLQVLIQCDNSVQSGEWYQEIKNAIKALPSGRDHGKCEYEE